MHCPDSARLKETYDLALRAWQNTPRAEFVDGRAIGAVDPHRRKHLLEVRLNAAKNLYHHSVTCAVCKHDFARY